MCGQKAEEQGGQGEETKAESVTDMWAGSRGQERDQTSGGDCTAGAGGPGSPGFCRDTHNPQIGKKPHTSECCGVPSTLTFQQEQWHYSGREGCATPVSSPQPWRNLIIFSRSPPDASSSLVSVDGRWTLLGRARLALVLLLTHIYLLSQKQTCQS